MLWQVRKGAISGRAALDAAAAVATTTWNPSDKDAGVTLSGGNLIASGTADAKAAVRAIASASSGKKFWKVTATTINSLGQAHIGAMDASAALNGAVGDSTHGVGIDQVSGSVLINGGSIGGGDPWAVGNDVFIAIDIPNNLFWFKVNSGFWNANPTFDPATGVGGFDMSGRAAGALFAAVSSGRFGSGGTFDVFTADFSGSGAPSGFGAW